MFSHIFMKTGNILYGSAWMLMFKNDFTKPLSLLRNHNNTYSFTLFYFSKFKLFICFLHNTLCYLWFWEKNKILLEVWHNTLNIVTHNLNKHPSWIHEFILKERLVYIQDLFKPVVFYKFKYKFPVFVQGLFGKPLMLWPF